MTTAAATPSTFKSVPDLAAVFGKALRALGSCIQDFRKLPVNTSLSPRVLNDIGLSPARAMALKFA